MEVKSGLPSGPRKTVLFPWIQVSLWLRQQITKIVWAFFQYQILNGSVLWVDVSQKKGSAVMENMLKLIFYLTWFVCLFCFYFISIHYHTQKQKTKKKINWNKYMDVKKEQGFK